MFVFAAIAILIAFTLAVIAVIRGPHLFDRALAGNVIGTLAILLLAVVGFLTGRPEWLDIALTYGLLNLIGTLAVLKYFRHGDLAFDAIATPPRASDASARDIDAAEASTKDAGGGN